MIYAFIRRQLAKNLAGNGFYPIPPWLRRYFGILPMSQRIYMYARLCEGNALYSIVDKDVACAESVSRLLLNVDSTILPNVITGTWTFYDFLTKSARFERVNIPGKGDIVLSPTGFGNGKIKNGHIGIVAHDGIIYSNASMTGKWTPNYTLKTWWARWGTNGYPVLYYRIKY